MGEAKRRGPSSSLARLSSIRACLSRVKRMLLGQPPASAAPCAPEMDLERDGLLDTPLLDIDWTHVQKPRIGIVKPRTPVVDPYWTKFAAYCEQNQLPYEFYDAHAHDWLDKGKHYDVVVWRVLHAYADDLESQEKIYILDKRLGKTCFPSYDEVWHYNNKLRQSYLYEAYDLPHIPTFVFHRQAEAEEFVMKCDYPLIWKLYSGASGTNVGKLDDCSQALDHVRKAFASQLDFDSRTPCYVYFQEFIAQAKYDLRVIVVGDYLVGYYRRVPEGGFKASGSGLIEKGPIPLAALELAWKVKSAMGGTMLAVDMIDDGGKYRVIETSTFCKVLDPSRQQVDGVPGRYVRRDGQFVLEAGRFWIQHMVMDELLCEYVRKL